MVNPKKRCEYHNLTLVSSVSPGHLTIRLQAHSKIIRGVVQTKIRQNECDFVLCQKSPSMIEYHVVLKT
jgi:hypothetical protein